MTRPPTSSSGSTVWPSLQWDEWRDTCETLHLWTQIVGKVRLKRASPQNHWWHAPLYVTARGLTTSAMPHGLRAFQIDFDFIDHELRVLSSDGGVGVLKLAPRTVADFYGHLMRLLGNLRLETRIWTQPQELEKTIPFEKDQQHKSYDPDAAHRFWLMLVHANRVLNRFRSDFVGKCSPVHFFWGSFDLAVSRFSGRTAPPHPGGVPNMADWVAREGYSHELVSVGFWPGNEALPEPAFYSYAYPEPDGFAEWPVLPDAAYYHRDLREFILPYEAVRRADDPDAMVLAFLQSTYEAAAERGGWDRKRLERDASSS